MELVKNLSALDGRFGTQRTTDMPHIIPRSWVRSPPALLADLNLGLPNVRVPQPFSTSDDVNGRIHHENEGGELVPLR